jgi:AcrR family transcriptional regulator
MGASQDKRVERSKTAVLAETYRQLTASGLSGVSVDAVARNSGVAKTTIYRHWPSRSALLIEACSQVGSAQAVPDTGSMRGDLLTLAGTVAEQLWAAGWPSVIPSIIDAAERDSDIAGMFCALHQANMAPFYAVVQRAMDRGEIRPDSVAGDLVAAVVGPLFYRRWFSKESIDKNFVEAVVDAVVDAARPGKASADTTTSARRSRRSSR